ncbi:MAG: glycosyltransferase family 39 protein [Flavobacteriales bacterium]|nr:MAG: glycosyltransferase family 39 protein [Flavobacteriales bacterium]
MANWSNARIQWLIALGALLLFVPGLGAVHLFDWDEINFAEIAREMVASGDWWRPQMAFEPFHEKPPLFIWMQAACMSVFGIDEFAARLPNAICGAVTLVVLFRIGARERGRTFGLLWVLAYVGSILPHLYFHSGIIDPWFNLFIFLSLYAIIRCVRERSSVQALLSGALLGLATMTKGPAAIIILGLTVGVYWAANRFRMFFAWKHVALLLAALVVVTGLWFGIDYLRNGPAFSAAFFQRQVELFTQEDAGHGGFVGYHFVVLLLGCFPASLFALQELLKPTRDEHHDFRRWMLVLFWVVLILFSIVSTKIVHYSSLCYFPLTFLAALQLERVWEKREGFGWTRFALGILGNIVAVVVIVLPFAAMHIERFKPLFAADPFALGNLEADVHWTGLEALAGLVLFGSLTAAHFLHQRARYRQSILVTFGGVVVFIWATLFFFINNIEGYSQRAAVEFFQGHTEGFSVSRIDKLPKSHPGEPCWLLTKGYKSYVPEFYGRIKEAQPPEDVLYHGAIERPVYLSCKVTHVHEVEAIGTFTEVARKNGFVFYIRRP